MSFHNQKYLMAQRSAINAINLNKKMQQKLLGNHNHISGGLLRENFGYAKKILQQRAKDIQEQGSTSYTSTNFDTSNQGKDLSSTQIERSVDNTAVSNLF